MPLAITDRTILMSGAGLVGATQSGFSSRLSAADARTLLGLSTANSPSFSGMTLSGHLLFNATNTYDIGNGTYDPRTVRAATSLRVKSSVSVGTSSFGAAYTDTISTDNTISGAAIVVHATDATTRLQIGQGGSTYGFGTWFQSSFDNGGGGAVNEIFLNPIGGQVVIGSTSVANAHTVRGTFTTPSLTASTGDGAFTLASPSQNLSFGHYQASPFGLWIQAKGSNAALPLIMQPLGGPVVIGATTNDGSGNLLQVAGGISATSLVNQTAATTLGNATYGVTVPGAIASSGGIVVNGATDSANSVTTGNGAGVTIAYLSSDFGHLAFNAKSNGSAYICGQTGYGLSALYLNSTGTLHINALPSATAGSSYGAGTPIAYFTRAGLLTVPDASVTGTVQVGNATESGTGAKLCVETGIYTPGFLWSAGYARCAALTTTGDISMSKTSAQGYIRAYSPDGTKQSYWYTTNAGLLSIVSPGQMRFEAAGSDYVCLGDGATNSLFRVYSATNAKYTALTNDGTDGILSTSSGRLQLQGATNTVLAPTSGISFCYTAGTHSVFEVYSSTGGRAINLTHDNTNGTIQTTSGGGNIQLVPAGGTVAVTGGITASGGATITGGGVTSTGGLKIGSLQAGVGGIWDSAVTPSSTNYAFITNTSSAIVNASSAIYLRIGGVTDVATITTAGGIATTILKTTNYAIFNYGGSPVLWSAAMANADATAYRTLLNRGNVGTIVTASSGIYGWCSTTSLTGGFETNDTGLARDSAGVVEINNGTLVSGGGSYGGLKCAGITASGVIQSTAGFTFPADTYLNTPGPHGRMYFVSSGASIWACGTNSGSLHQFRDLGGSTIAEITASGCDLTGTFTFTGGMKTGFATKVADYTLTSSDYTVVATTGTFALTLPTAVGCAGRIYVMKNIGTGVITINTTSSQTIDADVSGAITLNQWDALTVQSTGSNWIII